ncbi:hypothetical protein AWC38_SpisGene23954 [Stylophora pistillata]|uniref:Uncharacterized protein n=1 Tax=Stylophora pistillata TaxID=50429 RepID=A0A2B4R4Q5_STYPI|nr:hypothetical protein AWC38_SpisGene23954 [Stylophora pistillata]
MEKEEAELNAKIKTLKFWVKKTDEILQKDNRAALERHRTSLEIVVTAVTTLKESIEEKKFAEGEDEQAVQEWAEEFEESVDEADKCMRQLASKIELIHRKSKHEAAIFEHRQAIRTFHQPSVAGDFKLDVDITKVNKRELLVLENPSYKPLIKANPHLKAVRMDDEDTKQMLPVHIMLGANDFAKIRTGERLRVGCRGDPVAESTRSGWTVMSPGADSGLSPALSVVNSNADYEKLCALDVLGLANSATGDQSAVYDEFMEQLVRSPEGWYETGLPWKENCPPLPNNREGSLRRLNTLARKLRKTDLLDEYDAVIREQLEEGIVERAPVEVTGRVFFLSHRAVVRRNAETTKLRVVHDASARAQEKAPSLNDCVHAGPQLQNKLWSFVVRN